MAVIGGKLSLIVDGDTYAVGDGDHNVDTQTLEREIKMGANGRGGVIERPKMVSCEGALFMQPNTNPLGLKDLKDVTVQIQVSGGKTYVLKHAYAVTWGPYNITQGTLPYRFEAIGDDLEVLS